MLHKFEDVEGRSFPLPKTEKGQQRLIQPAVRSILTAAGDDMRMKLDCGRLRAHWPPEMKGNVIDD